MKKSAFYLLAISVFTLGLVSCTDDSDMEAVDVMATSGSQLKAYPGEIVQVAYNNGFNLFASALIKSELNKELELRGPVTVFAPTDAAFTNFLAAIGQTSIDDIPMPVLKQVLLNHILIGEAVSTDIASIEGINTMEGSMLEIKANDQFIVNNAAIINPYDLSSVFGVFHAIDQVLIPATIEPMINTVLAPAYFNKNFSTLVNAVVKAGLVDALLSAPSATIFAPTNEAFLKANIDPMQVDVETLTKVLLYHVMDTKVMSSELPIEAVTLADSHVFFSKSRTGSFINGNAQITGVDIQSGSGVVHVINDVLLPAGGTIVEKAIELTATGEFTSLVAALVRTAEEGTPNQNLISVLSSEGPFSVFAPTNAAFQKLLDENAAWSTLYDIPLNTLIEVLTYHVVPARAYDKDLETVLNQNNQLATAAGQTISVDLNSLTINGKAQIIDVNTHASNGVIHVIDHVLLPSVSYDNE